MDGKNIKIVSVIIAAITAIIAFLALMFGEDWGHGGKVLDANGNELDIDASFYATTDGVFAVELPEDMPSGTYTYLLYLFVHDEYCEARIPFTW